MILPSGCTVRMRRAPTLLWEMRMRSVLRDGQTGPAEAFFPFPVLCTRKILHLHLHLLVGVPRKFLLPGARSEHFDVNGCGPSGKGATLALPDYHPQRSKAIAEPSPDISCGWGRAFSCPAQPVQSPVTHVRSSVGFHAGAQGRKHVEDAEKTALEMCRAGTGRWKIHSNLMGLQWTFAGGVFACCFFYFYFSKLIVVLDYLQDMTNTTSILYGKQFIFTYY